MKLPSVSVVFLSYKQERYVREALLGALNQDLPAYELIIADDASPDSTVAVIESVLAENPRPHVSIKVIKQPKNLGLVGNFNAALAAATGEVFVMMAGDDVSYPQRSRLMAEAFAKNPKVRAVTCASRHINAEGLAIPSRSPSPTSQTFEHGRGRRTLSAGAPVTGALVAYHRSASDIFGPLSLDAGVEDTDYVFRALILGSVMYLGEVLVDYRMHAGNLSNFQIREQTDEEILQRESRWATQVAKSSLRWMRNLELGLQKGFIDAARFAYVAKLIEKTVSRHELLALSLDSAPRSLWIPAAWRLIRSGGAIKAASLYVMWISGWRRRSHARRVRGRRS